MAIHLTVGPGLGALVDPLVQVLADVPADLFAPQTLVVPGEGVRSWLTWQLADRVQGGNGIVANMDWMFPSSLIRRALGTAGIADRWSVDPLTWAIHSVFTSGDHVGPTNDVPDLTRSRAIADVFDRYGLRRPGMVAAWERGHDVDTFGRPLPDSQRWQPRLWRQVAALYGAPSTAVQNFERLATLTAQGPPDDVPDQVVIVGVTGLPLFQLEVLLALSRHREVHLLSPVASTNLWGRLVDIAQRHHHGADLSDVARTDDPAVHAPRHPLLDAWGRSGREAQFNLARITQAYRLTPVVMEPVTAPHDAASSLLQHLRHGLETDTPPPNSGAGGVTSAHAETDRSIRWHRCHGPARQADVLRDVLIHLFEELDENGQPRFEPRDVTVLCPDLSVFGPLVQASFAGSPGQGIPSLPVRLADRTLGADTPLVDVVTGVFTLLERRWRRSEVLDFARLPAVRRRFSLTLEQLGLVDEWLDATNVRWGLSHDDHQRQGFPEQLRAHTFRDGLDQLVVGAALAPGSLTGPGDVAPTGDLEGDDVELLGVFADLLDGLAAAVEILTTPTSVRQWIQSLQGAVSQLAELPEPDAWQWGAFERELNEFADAADLAHPNGGPAPVEPLQVADLVAARLGSQPGRVRFETGSVTVSTLAGQRGIPRRVVCLLGMDESMLGSGVASSDDLVTAQPVLGDPDGRAEIRAQLLDAVLAAQDRLLVFSTGHDVRTNDDVAPAVALAELVDVIDSLAGGLPARERWVVDHPRQPWSARSFQPGALGEPGPFSFHRGALAMFERSLGRRHGERLLAGRLPNETADRELTQLKLALDDAVRALLGDRCGVTLADETQHTSSVIPLSVASLDAWRMRDQLLQAATHIDGDGDADERIDQYLDLARRRGELPPLALGDAVALRARHEVQQLMATAQGLGAVLGIQRGSVDIDLPLPSDTNRRLRGRIEQVGAQQIVHLTASRHQPGHLLRAWVELAALCLAQPDSSWEAVVVGSASGKAGAAGRRLRLQSLDAAREVLIVAGEFTDRARQGVLPLTATLSYALHSGGPAQARQVWTRSSDAASHRWVRWAVGDTDFHDLLELAPWPDEGDDMATDTASSRWGAATGRLERWSHRLWSTFETTVAEEER